MYISVTGLKTYTQYASMMFWLLTIPAFKAGQKADGILLCEKRAVTAFNIRLLSGK